MNTHKHESILEAQEFYERAEQLLREDASNMSAAVKCFRRTLFLDPRNINAILRVAALYESGGADFQIDRRRQMALYLRAARLGHAPSQLKLGWAYSFHGYRETLSGASTDIRVVPYDLKRSAHWFLKAAEQGNRSAQSELGLAYFRGRGVEQDYTKASEWLSKSAMSGDRTAMNNLGLAYSEGLGVEQNLAFAATCYSVASRWGYAVATYNLGLAYEHGRGLDVDKAKAIELFQLASEQNDHLDDTFTGRLIHKIEDIQSRFIYFAYGSNMATSRLMNRTPSARVHGYGYLNGHKLAFDKISRDGSGKATIERSDKSKEQVWGVLYSISKDEMEKLDEAEGKGYERQSIVLDNWDSLSEWDEGKIEVVAYLATKRDSSLCPYHWYKEYVIVGAVEHELPKSYIDSIRDVVSIQDLDDKRRAKHETILGPLKAQLAEPDENDQVKDIFS